MAKAAKKKAPAKKVKEEPPLAIIGSFQDVIGVAVGQKPPAPKRKSKKK